MQCRHLIRYSGNNGCSADIPSEPSEIMDAMQIFTSDASEAMDAVQTFMLDSSETVAEPLDMAQIC